jgi:hypothetical protein
MSGFQGIFQSDPVNKDTPILWGHGTADPIVPFRLQEVGAPQLKDLGLKVRTSCIALCEGAASERHGGSYVSCHCRGLCGGYLYSPTIVAVSIKLDS